MIKYITFNNLTTFTYLKLSFIFLLFTVKSGRGFTRFVSLLNSDSANQLLARVEYLQDITKLNTQ